MFRGTISAVALMALILNLDARSLYRRKRWTSRPSETADIRDALRELEMREKVGYENEFGNPQPKYPFYPGEIFEGSKEGERNYPSFASYATPADMAELREILEPKPRKPYNYESETETIDPEDVAALLEANEKSTENSTGDVTPEPVSQAELENIYSSGKEDEKEKKSVVKKRTDKRKNRDAGEATREWLMEHANEVATDDDDKKKRQMTTPNEASEVQALARENSLLLEENEYLAGALNAATMGQLEHTDRYMREQYEFLKKAVKAEEALESLNKELEDDDKEKKKRLTVKKDTMEDEMKRGRALPNDDEFEKMKQMPVKKDDYNGINPLLRKLIHDYNEEQAEMQEMKKKKRQRYEGMENQLPLETPGISTSPVILDKPADNNDAPDNDDEDLVANLQTMVSNLTPSQRKLMEEEISTLLESGLLESQCPAVESVADNCALLMKKFSVSLDEQARDVCNRHKVCYSCGSSIDPQKTLNKEACDAIFLEQSKALCADDKECHQSSQGLFVLMKREHNYIDWPSPVTAELCSERCVVDYLLDGQ